ncbi:tetratricopeptide repeat protein [Stieleria sp.]|uniref:tetratricopeptide repeat protein n=1 Tax=Stieleria sp. TaxID=2795976 RepID=UPI00356A06C2
MSKPKTLSRAITAAVGAAHQPDSAATRPDGGDLPRSVFNQIRSGNYAAAYHSLRTLPPNHLYRNCLGVCAMRTGKFDEAIQIFRGLALSPGTTIVRGDADDVLLINYATALLLGNLPSGALDVLGDLKDRDAPAAVEIRSAIDRWARGLSFWRRLDWKLNHIEPRNCSVPIDFAPGVFPITDATWANLGATHQPSGQRQAVRSLSP